MKIAHNLKVFSTILMFFTIVTIALNILYDSYCREYFYRYYSPSSEPLPRKKIAEDHYDQRVGEFRISLPYRHVYFSQSFSSTKVEESLHEAGLDKNTTVLFRDESYCFVDSVWFDKYALWWIDFIKSNNVDFKQDNFDCDNFSDLFMAIYGFASLNTTVRPYSQVACGTVIVENVNEFARIPALADSWHSLNIVWTNNGWFVIEPQNGIYISLESYPNKNNIKAIIF